MRQLILMSGLVAVLFPSLAHAYIGPGAGAGTVAVVLGVLGSFVLALVAIVWYPLKRLIKGRKAATKKPEKTDSAAE